MLKVQLYTSMGEPVESVIVPPFDPMPEVIVWGQRSFVRNAKSHYFEGMMYPAWSEGEMRSQGRGIPAEAILDYHPKAV